MSGPGSSYPTRAALLEAMARAHCRHNLESDPDERGALTGRPIWQLWSEEMEPILDAIVALAGRRAEREVIATVMGEAA